MSEDDHIASIKKEITELEEEIRNREKHLREARFKLHYRRVDLQNTEFIRDYNQGKRSPT